MSDYNESAIFECGSNDALHLAVRLNINTAEFPSKLAHLVPRDYEFELHFG